jgi:hypothetical protein
MQQHRRILATREQKRGALELCDYLSDDVHCLGFEGVEVGELVGHETLIILVNI